MTDEFNFDHSVEQAWRRFSLRLGNVLSMMDETEPLTLSPFDPVDGQWYVKFFQIIKDRISARLPLSLYGQALTDEQRSLILSFGWEETDDGFSMTVGQDESDDLAVAAVRVVQEVFDVEHPVFLESNVLAEILQEPSVSDGSLDTEPSGEEYFAFGYLNEIQLSAAVAQELTEVFGAVPMRDQDGDYAIRVGSTMIFVRIPSDGKEIRLFSVVVHDLAGRLRATEVINDVNAHSRWVRFAVVRDKIIATLSVHAHPFVAAHLRQAVSEIANVADGVDDLLADSLHGKTTFPESEEATEITYDL
ncbi:MAG: hypothetical protein FWD55_08020 [Propionibacteriaceae bacterium]|nr:hypothetical protein [Propionibacteriaceae bacterium]